MVVTRRPRAATGALPHLAKVAPLSPLAQWQRAAAQYAIDPYLVWAVLTGFRQFIRLKEKMPGDIDFIVELLKPYVPGVYPAWPQSAVSVGAWVPTEYGRPLPGGTDRSRFITLRLPAQGKEPQALLAPVLELIGTAGVKRIQIGFPRPPELADGQDGMTDAAWKWPKRSLRPKVLMGLLEDACPFGHPALATDPRHTRVWALWDQSSNRDGRPPPPSTMGYGAQLKQAQLDDLLQEHAERAGVDEAALYRDTRARQPLLARRRSHAAAVATLLAGGHEALPSHATATPCKQEASVQAGEALPPRPAADVAAKAPLVVVQFPYEQVAIPTARWMAVRALDGLRYLARGSAQLAPKRQPPLPLVANISYGSMAGSHDGTAMLESAMDELALAHGRMAITLAAGNGHGKRRDPNAGPQAPRLPSGRHAQAMLRARKGQTALGLYLPPNKAIETYLELWFCMPRGGGLKAGDVSIIVTPPPSGGLPPLTAACPDIQVHPTLGEPLYGLFVLPRPAQSTRQSLACLMVSATQVSGSRVEAPAGLWTVSITNHSAQEIELQAWVERDVLHGRAGQKQAARLVPLGGPNAVLLSDENTLNNIATGKETFRTSALQATRDSAGRHPVSPYSAAAENGAKGPEFAAVADTSPARPGIRVSGSTSGAMVRMNGTSVAAPQAARQIANRLARGDLLADIRRDIANAKSGDARRGRIEV